MRGELRIDVHDAQGAAVAPSGELASEANEFRRTFVASADGRYVAQAHRVNVINFASLFSGTAVEPPRSVSAKL